VLSFTFELAEAVHSFQHAIPVLICAKPISSVLPHVDSLAGSLSGRDERKGISYLNCYSRGIPRIMS